MSKFVENEMYVTKRNGKSEVLSFDKILNRIKKLGQEAGININYSSLVIKIMDQLFTAISTARIDELVAEQCASMMTQHIDYSTLAARILISNLHKNTDNKFSNTMRSLYKHKSADGEPSPLISKSTWDFIRNNMSVIDATIMNDRDYALDYFGFKTLEKSYLIKINDRVIERPQYMWMRVAIGIHGDNLELIKETYDMMSQKYFTHATPTLFNAGTPRPQLSSCFLVGMEEDSINGIYNTLKDCANISKYSGGIGIHAHNIRAKNSNICGTNGCADGLVPMLRVFNSTARYVHQTKRPGSFAVYIEPWHADVSDFLDLKKNHGDEELRARDLFYAMWIPDLFMERVRDGKPWSTFCPKECPLLSDLYGDEFTKLYEKYEGDGLARDTVDSRALWRKILNAQMETGTPYMLYKDAINRKSNQKNVGVIKSSNLCCEITEYSDERETAVCNLASIGLPMCMNPASKTFDYDKLHQVTKVVINNLNRVIDRTFYPTDKARVSNIRHRPVGVGVQGLADVFFMMDIAFHSDAAREVNKAIFETIYHAALEKSNEIAIERRLHVATLDSAQRAKFLTADENKLPDSYVGAYASFCGSPASEGVLQYDMWGVSPSDRYDWAALKESIVSNGIRNSLLVAPMPTASTSQILGYNECFEPITSNIYTRRTLAGEFVVPNKYLMKELIDAGEWSESVKNNIIENKGSIQQLTHLSDHMRNKYKIVWEMPMKHLIDMSVDRGAFICQSQSLNLWMEDPVYKKLTAMHFYAWSNGLKTGIYYLRRKAKHQAQQFTIEPSTENSNSAEELCEMCSA
jgi:ribonucleotide reductase alpha subunit